MDDPLLAEARRLRGETPDDDPLVAEARNIRQPQQADRRMGKTTAGLTAAVSGLPGMEAIGGLISSLTGGTYQGGRRSIAEAQRQARESIGAIPYEAIRMAPGIAAMAAAPVTAAPRVLGTMLGRAGLSGGIEAVRGAARAGMTEQEAPSLAETAEAAGKGLGFGAVGSVIGEGAVRGGLGLFRGLRGFAGEGASNVAGTGVIPRVQQGVADVLRSETAQRIAPRASRAAAELIEPIAAPRAQRVLQETLPTPQSATEFREAAQASINRANAATAARRAERADVTRTAQESLAEMAGQRQRTRSQLAGDVRVAREQADAVVGQARARAAQEVNEATQRLRASLPRETPTNADELRDIIRTRQTSAGDVSYTRAFQLADGVDFSPVARQVESVVRRNPEVAAAYRDAFTRGGAQEAGEDVLPALDLPTFDRMRQNISERVQAFMRGDATGIPRARASQALKDIAEMEDAYINRIREVRGDDAATALREARAEYAEYFRQLDALADGRNLGRFGFGKTEGSVTPSRMNIAWLEQNIQQVSPEAREAFQVGAREWVNDVIRRTPEDARRLANNLVGTEERFRRTALALGEDTANDLRTMFRDVQQVREAARNGLKMAREQARGVVGKARTEAQAQADIVASQVAAARRQVTRDRNTFLRRLSSEAPEVGEARQARELSRQMGLARNAVRNLDNARGFATAVLPNMSPEARVSAARVMAGRIDDDIMALMTQPNGAQRVAERFAELRQNPATSALLGRALDEAERRLRTGVPLRRPVGAVLGGSTLASVGQNR